MSQSFQFTPGADNTRQLRDAFGQFATGVTVVTAASDEGDVAITANSFTSLSLTPPLVLWAADRKARRFRYFEAARHFAIHVLSAEQNDLCWQVAKDTACLRDQDLARNAHEGPLLDNALARFECELHAMYDGGDHAIFVARVQNVEMRDSGDALAFFKGQSVRFANNT